MPVQYIRSVWERVKPHVPRKARVLSVAKGIENGTLLRPTQIIGEVLRHRGCEVVVCETGAGAIDQIEAGALEGTRFDLIVSDIRMPDRNGYEVFAASRRSTPGVPVILMTGFGYDPHHSIVRASQEGLQAVLFKPFEVEKLLIEVRQALTTPKRGS